jgi:hypothetical protein
MPWIDDERYLTFLSLVLFFLPALVVPLSTRLAVPPAVLKLAPFFVLVGPSVYWFSKYLNDSTDSGERTGVDSRGELSGLRANETTFPHVELIATNYARLSEESQYRDDLLIRANYFSLAVIAVLIGTLLQASTVLRPLVAMMGVAIAYSFWLATESYKGARDALNDGMRRTETQFLELSVVKDYDTRPRSQIEKRSLSSYFIGLQMTTTFVWLVLYVFFVAEFVYL